MLFFVFMSSAIFSLLGVVPVTECKQLNANEALSILSLSSNITTAIDDEDKSDEISGRFLNFDYDLSKNPDNVTFWLFKDFENPNQSHELVFNNPKSVDVTAFNPKQETIFLIHGFWSNRSSHMPFTIKNAFLNARVPYNIIIVDWSGLSTPDPPEDSYVVTSYITVVKRSIPLVSQRVADFIKFMITEKFATPSRIHLIGHSLGAHISGAVGRTVASFPENFGKLARVTGLDPAGPLFNLIESKRRITKSDGEFVDIYHTGALTLGVSIFTDGHVNFIVNKGHHQPGCIDSSALHQEADGGSCSHAYVSTLYAATISRNFTGCLCEPGYLLLADACPGKCQVNAVAGESCPNTTKGQFQVLVAQEDPLADEAEVVLLVASNNKEEPPGVTLEKLEEAINDSKFTYFELH